MTISLIAGASTQSRARRPLPPGAIDGYTLDAEGAREFCVFTYPGGRQETHSLLSWIGGQAGLIFGASPKQYSHHLHLTHGSYGHRAERHLTEALGRVFDGYLSDDHIGVRFFQNGGDACSAAVRLARYATGCDAIATQGYHGAATDFAHEPDYSGYPASNLEAHHRFEFGDVAGLVRAARYAACIMIEVPAIDDEVAIASFLKECRDVADNNGIPLIVDDVVCGFRVALAGTCERYGVKADLVCLGKAISANGCVSALIGRYDLMKLFGDKVFYSTTFGGQPGPCEVAAETVQYLSEHRQEIYGVDGHLTRIGQALKSGFNARGIRCVGQPERSVFSFLRDEDWLEWCSQMIERGVMVHRPNFVTLAHSMKDVDTTMVACEAVLEGVK